MMINGGERGDGVEGSDGRGFWRRDSWDETKLLRDSDDDENNDGENPVGFFELDFSRRNGANHRNTFAHAPPSSKLNSSMSINAKASNPFKMADRSK